MSYKIDSIDFVDTVTRHAFYIKIKRKEFYWYLITDIDECNMPQYRIQWRSDEPEDIDEDDLINDLIDSF